MNIRKRRIVGTAAALAATAALTGLTVQASATTAVPSPETAAFCAAQIAFDTAMLEMGGPDGPPADPGAVLTPRLDELEAAATPEVAAHVGEIARVLREGLAAGSPEALEGAFSSDAYTAADAAVDQHLLGNCGYGHLKATATEYMFDGVPDSAAGGPTAVTLTNEGEEFHMIVLLRKAEGETRTAQELLALPDDEILQAMSFVAEVFLAPGTTGTAFYDLAAGNYIAVCFMPVGSRPGGDMPAEDAKPHFMEGMLQEFTLT